MTLISNGEKEMKLNMLYKKTDISTKTTVSKHRFIYFEVKTLLILESSLNALYFTLEPPVL